MVRGAACDLGAMIKSRERCALDLVVEAALHPLRFR
jgi:hypothetical protein